MALNTHVVTQGENNLKTKFSNTCQGTRKGNQSRKDQRYVSATFWHTFWICPASSLVGERTSACVSRTCVSRHCKIEIENVAVFPVPDWALKYKFDKWSQCKSPASEWLQRDGFQSTYCAMTSRPFTIGLIDLCWMADGFSKPKKNGKFVSDVNNL